MEVIQSSEEMSEYEKIREKNIQERTKIFNQAKIASMNAKKYVRKVSNQNSLGPQEMIVSTNQNSLGPPQEMDPDLVIGQIWTIETSNDDEESTGSGIKCDFCNEEKEFTKEEFDKHVGELHFFKRIYNQLKELNYPYECIACHGQLLDTDEGVSHLEICYKFLKNMLELIPEYIGKTHMP